MRKLEKFGMLLISNHEGSYAVFKKADEFVEEVTIAIRLIYRAKKWLDKTTSKYDAKYCHNTIENWRKILRTYGLDCTVYFVVDPQKREGTIIIKDIAFNIFYAVKVE